MRQAIMTKFLGPTDSRGSRVKATSGGGLSVTVTWDHELDVERNHARAARALAYKHGWHGDWMGGGTKDGFCFVVVEVKGDFSV